MSKNLPPGISHLLPGITYRHDPASVNRPHHFRARSPHTGKVVARNFATVKQGMDWSAGQRAGMKARTLADGKVLWATAAADYLAAIRASGRRERYIASVEQITGAVTAGIGPQDMTRPAFKDAVREYLAKLVTAEGSRQPGQPASAATRLRYLAVIRAVAHQAMADRNLGIDPVAGIKGPKQRKALVQTLTLDEARACVSPTMETDPYFLRFALLLYLGLRERSEGLWLRWEDYDKARQIMQVRERDGVNELKTGEREVPVPAELVAILKRTPRRGAHILPERIRLDGSGDPVEDKTDYQRFKAFLRRALLPADPTPRQVHHVESRVALITRHSIRHLYARVMAATGVSLATLQTRMGHTAISTTAIYTQGADSYEVLVEAWPKGQWMLRPPVAANGQAVAE